MHNSKKALALFLSLAGMASLAGCKKSGDSTSAGEENYDTPMSEKVTITFDTNRTDLDTSGKFTEYIKSFNAVEPNITVKIQSYTSYKDDEKKKVVAKTNGVVSMIPIDDNDQLRTYYDSLGKYVDLAATGKYRNVYLTAKYYKGEVYGIPGSNTVGGVAYNKAIFKAAGLDTTTMTTPDTFIAGLKKIKDYNGTRTDGKTTIPYYTNGKDGWCMEQFEDHLCNDVLHGDADYHNTYMAGDQNVFSKDAPNGDAHYLAGKMFFNLIDQGLTEADPTTTDWEGSKLKIANGTIGCMVMGNWAISQFQGVAKDNNLDPNDIGYMPFPFTAKDGKQYANSGADYCYGIKKTASDKEKSAGKRFIKWMVEKSKFAVNEGCISSWAADGMPDNLSAFSNCTMFTSNAAKEGAEKCLGLTETLAGQKCYDGGARFSQIISDAKLEGKTSEERMAAFDADMKKWNDSWKAAAKSIGEQYPVVVKAA